MSYLAALQDAIKRLHGCHSKHVQSVPVTEQFQDKIIWTGTVEIFDLREHPKAKRCYAWSHPKDEGGQHFITVLEVPPVDSAQKAVQVSILSEAKREHK
jgi:hypothetical protein